MARPRFPPERERTIFTGSLNIELRPLPVNGLAGLRPPLILSLSKDAGHTEMHRVSLRTSAYSASLRLEESSKCDTLGATPDAEWVEG